MMYNAETTNDSVATTALQIDGPQPVWMTLNQARERVFTGELVFETEPEVVAYLDHGVVYYAERTADAPLGQRLLDAGVLDVTQLESGVVRIGDLEHLGRLFDRDSSIDRHAVIVTAELFTEELIAELANRAVADVRVTAYRHHPSGVHRWFVAPADRIVVPRPLSAVGQLDGTIVDDLPSLPYGFEEDELMIEWDVIPQVGTGTDVDTGTLTNADTLTVTQTDTDTDTQTDTDTLTDTESDTDAEGDTIDSDELDSLLLTLSVDDEPSLAPDELDTGDVEFAQFVDDADGTDDTSDWTAETDDQSSESDGETEIEIPDFELAYVDFDDVATPEPELSALETSVDPTEGSEDFEFSVVWPDGSARPADLSGFDLDEPTFTEPVFTEPVFTEPTFTEPTFTETDDGELQFSMPPLTLSDELGSADADVPDDVADAVRRAIAAIESASVDASHGFIESDDAMHETGDDEITELVDFDVTDVTDAPAAERNGFGGFAPPTMATRAEVLYAQMSDDAAMLDEVEQAPGATPVGDDHGASGDRASSLRRLIGSLRRKDS